MALGIFKGNQVYDRTKLLAGAVEARKRGKRKRAIELYRKVLDVEPGNLELHRRIAPLLAETKQEKEACESYRRVGEGLVQSGLYDQGIGVYREAAGYFPRQVEIWEAIARLQLKRGRRKDAIICLIEGRGHFRSRKQRSEAIRLLLQAREVDPYDFDASFDLARLLARNGSRRDALRILGQLATRYRRRALRRIRGLQFRLAPRPRGGWLWFRALVRGF